MQHVVPLNKLRWWISQQAGAFSWLIDNWLAESQLRTLGLDHDLSGMTARGGVLPAPAAALSAPFTSTRLQDYPEMDMYGVIVSCSARADRSLTSCSDAATIACASCNASGGVKARTRTTTVPLAGS